MLSSPSSLTSSLSFSFAGERASSAVTVVEENVLLLIHHFTRTWWFGERTSVAPEIYCLSNVTMKWIPARFQNFNPRCPSSKVRFIAVTRLFRRQISSLIS